MKLYLSHSSNFDYETELYAPLRHHLANQYEIFFPHDPDNVDTKSKDIIASSDYVLAEVSYPSTGQGIELGWADTNNVPLVCFYRSGSEISHSLKFVSNTFIEYDSSQDLINKLGERLKSQ